MILLSPNHWDVIPNGIFTSRKESPRNKEVKNTLKKNKSYYIHYDVYKIGKSIERNKKRFLSLKSHPYVKTWRDLVTASSYEAYQEINSKRKVKDLLNFKEVSTIINEYQVVLKRLVGFYIKSDSHYNVRRSVFYYKQKLELNDLETRYLETSIYI